MQVLVVINHHNERALVNTLTYSLFTAVVAVASHHSMFSLLAESDASPSSIQVE